MATEPIKIFYCYAHEDKELRDELERHLGALKRTGQITTWYDREIQPGTEWAHEIDRHLNSADIVLLLISSHFIDSDYCYGQEMHRALERQEAKEAHVIPILLRPVDCEGIPIGKLQLLPSGKRPITSWPDRDQAFLDVVKGIRGVIKSLYTQLGETNHEINERLQETSQQFLPEEVQRHMINTQEAITLFHQLMQPNSQRYVLRLLGDGKMGKSHLLTNVFPFLAQQDYQARWALLDLSYRFHTVPDLLSQACAQFGNLSCDGYYAADLDWNKQSKTNGGKFTTSFSHADFSAQESQDAARNRDRILTTHFVKDIGKLDDKPLMLLFDSVDRASEEICMWLMEMLLVPISRLPHVRTVIAGRFLPEAHGSYRAFCQSFRLLPIKEIEAYIAYCQQIQPTLSEDSIKVLAHAFDYIPGLFVEVLPKFLSSRASNG